MELQRISHYRVDRLIGVGGMGEVYLADDPILNRKVALKLLPIRFSEDAERVRRFQREARAASALNHPNIITIYEIGEADQRHYIATEYIEGETLRSRIVSPKAVGIGDVLNVAIGVTNALAAAHDAGIIHRDIKPENIMLRPDGYVKVLDFGLAKLTGGTDLSKESNTGAVMGTLLYISPEQARGIAPDARSDIYSFGAVLYELLTRQPPIATDNLLELAIAIASRTPAPPSAINPAVPQELDRIVMKALQKDRERRYQTAREMLADLRTLQRELDFENKLHATHPDSDPRPILATQHTALLTFPPGTTSTVFRVGRMRVRKALLVVLLAIISMAALIAYGFLRGGWVGGRSIDSVAVLPFVNASGDPNSEYLSDGLSDSITDSLSQLPQLKVIARSAAFRYKGKANDPLLAGHELRVRGIVTGKVIQRGDMLVIRCALTDVNNGTQLWGQQYSRRLSDVLSVQEEMAQEISGQLRTKLSGEEKRLLTRRNADNSEAFQLYLEGRYYRYRYNEEAIRKAIVFFNQAIARDPTYALAYTGLADAYYGLSNLYMAPRDAMPKAREAAKRALALDDSLAQAHTQLALVLAWYDWDFAGGEREFRRAIALNPNDAEAHRLYGDFLTATGHFDGAVAEKRKAEELDPLSVPASWDVGRALFYSGRVAEATEQVKRTVELDDHFANTYYLQAHIAMVEDRKSDAIVAMRKAIELGGRTPLFVTSWGYFNARAGNREEALRAIAELKSRPNYTLPLFLARIEAGLGENDKAIKLLEQAYNDRSESIVWLKVDPTLRGLRNDPRFLALQKRVGV